MKKGEQPAAASTALEALESADGEWLVLSFPLGDGSRPGLTPTESEVVALLLRGLTNAEIAAVRGTSIRTVANQVSSLFRKLGVRSRLELVALAPLMQK